MNPQIQSLKGFRDFLSKVALKRDWLKNQIIKVFELWGYDPLETPTLEPLELFEGQIGEEEKLFFKFKDPGNRDVALRYDQTVPICRVVGQYAQTLPLPFRRYQIQPAFRAEKPQSGRYREFLQCDADIFGIDSSLADAEVIALGLDIYRRLGFKQARVLINDRSLLTEIPYEAIVAIDKLKKIGRDGVVNDMQKKGIDQSTAQQYLNQITSLKPNQTITLILEYLENLGFEPDWYAFDPTIARSFAYSTGPIWEIEIPGFEAGSVLGGERFDQLVKQISGIDVPGTGFGLGFDRTLEAAEQFGLIPDFNTNTQILITVFNPGVLKASLKAATDFRAAGINTEVFPDAETNLQKQLKYANKKAIPYVAIIGPDEAKDNKLTLKNMASGDQQTLTPQEALSLLNA